MKKISSKSGYKQLNNLNELTSAYMKNTLYDIATIPFLYVIFLYVSSTTYVFSFPSPPFLF